MRTMSQGYVIVADGAPLRPDDILALMPQVERQFVVEHTPTMLAFAVYVANLLREDVAPLARRPVKSRPRAKRTAPKKQAKTKRIPPREAALAAVADALRREPHASLALLATMTGYSRSYVCNLRRQLKETSA